MPEIGADFLLGPGIASRAIAYFGQGANGYSHCASVLADGRYLDARSDTCGLVPPGVHIRHPGDERCIKRRHCTLTVTQTEYDDWEANLRAKITDKYGKGDIWDFILGREGHANGQWICSALLINALQHIKKIVYPLVIPAHQLSPNTAILLVQQAGFSMGPDIFAPGHGPR